MPDATVRAPAPMPDTAVLDVDGTLVDTNYHHALAWFRAFRRYDVTVPTWHLHRAIGMGGDQLVTHVSDEEVERRHGDDLRAAHGEEFDALIGEVRPLADAADLLRAIRARGLRVVLATSGRPDHAEQLLDLVHAHELADAWTSSSDVDASKPAPDLVHLALERAGGSSAVMVGDAVWDAMAARRAGYDSIAVRTGGFSVDELREAGAGWVYHSLADLIADLDATPLGTRTAA